MTPRARSRSTFSKNEWLPNRRPRAFWPAIRSALLRNVPTGARHGESTRVADRFRQLDPGKGIERGRQRIAYERDVVTRERSARSCPLSDNPESLTVRVDGRAARHTVGSRTQLS